jgi:RNA polymerase sigma factor (TIGR02999 family)
MSEESVTELLLAYGRGTPGAFDRLVELVYPALRHVARQQLLARGRPDAPLLDTTVLVHEAYFKMVDGSRLSLRDRSHFLAVAACAMRQVIVDHARSHGAHKRGAAAAHVPLEGHDVAVQIDADRILAINEALERLGKIDPRLLRVVECRFFAGYTEAETAEALSLSTKTVERDWFRAKALLSKELERST